MKSWEVQFQAFPSEADFNIDDPYHFLWIGICLYYSISKDLWRQLWDGTEEELQRCVLKRSFAWNIRLVWDGNRELREGLYTKRCHVTQLVETYEEANATAIWLMNLNIRGRQEVCYVKSHLDPGYKHFDVLGPPYSVLESTDILIASSLKGINYYLGTSIGLSKIPIVAWEVKIERDYGDRPLKRKMYGTYLNIADAKWKNLELFNKHLEKKQTKRFFKSISYHRRWEMLDWKMGPRGKTYGWINGYVHGVLIRDEAGMEKVIKEPYLIPVVEAPSLSYWINEVAREIQLLI